MIRRPPRSTLDRSSAASDVYKRQDLGLRVAGAFLERVAGAWDLADEAARLDMGADVAVSYTHLRAHETVLDLVCRLLLEKKKKNILIHSCIVTVTIATVLTSNRQPSYFAVYTCTRT